MATLVLSVVGNALGGPIGGAIGAAIGQQIDRAVIGGGKAREGPRLKELDVQTSSYGSSIPAIFGAMRVAGTVIWATDLIERKAKSGGGKGRPSTINYTYSVNMAVALSSRPLARIGRIWADGNLLRGAAGDFKVQTGFRFYNGYNDQGADPLIVSAEGQSESSAHRDLAYVVFEDLQLADFGNRIPSLTFEIFERETTVPLTDISNIVSKGLITGSSAETIVGYAADGRDVRAALAPLLASMPVTLSPRGDILEIRDWWQNAPSSNAIIAAQDRKQSFERPVSSLSTATQIPLSLAIKYYEPERDFQAGIQRSERSGVGRNTAQIELPAALPAPGAKRLADLQLLQIQRSRASWSGHVVLNENRLQVGDWVLNDSNPDRWRITEIEHLRGVSRVSAVRSMDSNPSQILEANPGRNVTSPDISAGETRIMAIDLPVIDTNDRGKPLVAIAAAGSQRGWRQAALSLQQGNMLLELGSTSGPAAMGSAVNALGNHSEFYTDTNSILDVDLLHDGMAIPSIQGLIWLNGELLRYGQAVYLGNKRYRLTQLQRGCYGSEGRTAQHQAGDPFLLLDPDTLRILDDVSLSINQQLMIEALGIGDASPFLAPLAVSGHATLPFAPVHAGSRIAADNGIELNWVRRSRIDYGWNDGIDQPLAEESEAYAIEAYKNSVLIANWNSNEPKLILPLSQITALQLSTGTLLTFSIRQIGRYGKSAPAELIVTIH
jgi:hypothetical protein